MYFAVSSASFRKLTIPGVLILVTFCINPIATCTFRRISIRNQTGKIPEALILNPWPVREVVHVKPSVSEAQVSAPQVAVVP